MKSKPTPKVADKKDEPKLSSDPLAELIAGTSQVNDEFPDGFVYFSSPTRWFGTYTVEQGKTPTGRGYEIEKTGTKVDIKDMEYLKSIREMVYCSIQQTLVEIAPIGVTSL